ncbi:hypothetical protein AUJ68_03505 [Candidatus Woesearchaeota archaeon CG1_02_57_44]|nr:MAG: hypothetical protein AUJ68_03505 [Candidatus Woesearchaeota archaeon CG1_02_57_44]
MQLKDFTPRVYQESILGTAAEKNTLVVLPTGLGKTHIFVMLAVQRLNLYPRHKVLFLGPTRPLIDQYRRVFEESTTIAPEAIATLTGRIAPAKRAEQWQECRVIFSTPQGLENDILGGRIQLKDICLLGFDEAHRAVGDYSYVWLAKRYVETARFPRVIALTASPGHELEKITEVCQNLAIEAVEIRTDQDPDVRPYVQEVEVEWVSIPFPTGLAAVRDALHGCFMAKLRDIRDLGMLNRPLDNINRKDILAMQRELHASMAAGDRGMPVLKSISLLAEAMKVQHALELVESQGLEPLLEYMEVMNRDAVTSKVKAVKNLVSDPQFKDALLKTRALLEKHVEHPKMQAVRDIVSQHATPANPDVKIIIFNQYRDQIGRLVDSLNKLPGIRAAMFVGQQKKKGTGLSQKEQLQRIKDFREHKYNVLCMSSVGEEGLDIPQVDMVLFYEPIPSAIRHIQRRGRTGRQDKGKVMVLVTKGTRDEAYRWSAHHKERKMVQTLQVLRQRLGGPANTKATVQRASTHNRASMSVATRSPGHGSMMHTGCPSNISFNSQQSLAQHQPKPDQVVIYADLREKPSRIVKELAELNALIKLKNLPVGDYILSDRVAIEVKTVRDFVDSLIDGRMLEQAKNLRYAYRRPLIIIEGTEDLYAQRSVDPKAIRGMIAALTIGWGIPLLTTRDAQDSASLIQIIAAREQQESGSNFSPHAGKPTSLQEQQEYIVSSLPGIGAGIAPKLLVEFGSVRKIMSASEHELQLAKLVGPKKAQEITRVLDAAYDEGNETRC